MSIYNSKLWISDLDKILLSFSEVSEFAGKSVMITGCTGLICSAIIDVFIRWNTTHNDKIKIFAAGRSRKNISERFNPYINEDWFIIVTYNASSTDNLLCHFCDYIIHGAGNASPNKITKEPVETMLSNFIGMKYLLDYAREKQIKRVLYISSSEIYGRKKKIKPFHIDEYGYIDLLNSRNSYSVSKRATETLCVAYADEYNVESVIVRPGHIYGPTALQSDTRVSSVWTYAAARGENIIMKSNGTQIRSYCYCLDCASAILKVLIKGKSVYPYNISNPNSVISIKTMAEILAKSANIEIEMEVPTEEEIIKFNPMNYSSLDSTELVELGWKGIFDAEQGFSHTVKILKEIYSNR